MAENSYLEYKTILLVNHNQSCYETQLDMNRTCLRKTECTYQREVSTGTVLLNRSKVRVNLDQTE